MDCTDGATVMMVRRNGSRPEDDLHEDDRGRAVLASEVLRMSPSAAHAHKSDDKVSVFWRVFGGTLLSITALVMIQAFQGMSSNIHELRNELTRMREQHVDFVKKDDFGSRTTSLWNKVQEIQTIQTGVSVVCNKVASIEQQLTTLERDRKEIQSSLANLATVKDRIEEQKKAAEVDHKELLNIGLTLNAMREKDAVLERLVRDGEGERKELIRELQALRERIAKLEGTKSASEKKSID